MKFEKLYISTGNICKPNAGAECGRAQESYTIQTLQMQYAPSYYVYPFDHLINFGGGHVVFFGNNHIKAIKFESKTIFIY